MSAKEFNQHPPRFLPEDDPVSPFTRAKKEWYDLLGNYRVQSYNWRRVALLSIFLSILLAAGLIYQSLKSTVTPYVIEVDSNTGMARAIGPAKEGSYSPKEAEVKYFIAQFVTKTRTVPLDPILYRQNWETAYLLMRKNVATRMNQILQNDNQTNPFGTQTVLPTIVSVVPATKDTYQVRWKEEVFDLHGGRKVIVPMTGLFTVEFEQPRDESTLMINPLGIYINDFNWSKDQK